MRGKRVSFGTVVLVFLQALAAQAQDVDVPGNLTMVDSTSTEGNILKGGVPFLHNFGESNTFLGSNAGNLTMSGSQNTASGSSALQNNTTGSYNTASGASALLNTTGDENTATGGFALFANTTGVYNTASGVAALYSNTIGESNTATGFQTLQNNTTGFQNTAIGRSALFGNATGNFNTALGALANVSADNLSNATAIGGGAVVDASNKVRVGNHLVTVIEGEVGFTSSSDRNRKENFEPVDGEEVLGKIGELSLTSWNFIGHDPKQFRHYGPMAQDFFAAFGHDGIGAIGTETTITSTDLDGILMIAAQALEKRTEEQKKEIQALRGENADLRARLETENADLEARLAALERKVGNSALAKAE